MNISQLLLLLVYCLGMSAGQMLFKHAAIGLRGAGSGGALVWQAATNIPLIAALALYAALTALWVYILTITDLSRAYSFNALPLVLTPLIAARLFDEKLNMPFYIGLAAIVAGVLIIAWGSEPQ